MSTAGSDSSLQPVHKELHAMDAKLWASETKGEVSSQEVHGSSTDFSMDDDTSLANGEKFRTREKHFGKVSRTLSSEH